MPLIETVSSIRRIPSTAAWSAWFLSPRPIQRAAAIAAASVTRTSSSARLRSGRLVPRLRGLHPLGCLDPDEVEAASDDVACRDAEREPERLLVALEHAVVV